MTLIWSDTSWEDYIYWQNKDRKTLKKVNEILKDISRNGYKCKGKPEPLKGNLSGFWSVRIDKKNRLVFRITGTAIEIAQCRTHYGES